MQACPLFRGLTFHFDIAIIANTFRGVAKLGIALGSGPRGPGFESRHSDHRPLGFFGNPRVFSCFPSLFWRIEFLEIWFDPNKTHTGKIPGSTGLVGSVLPTDFGAYLPYV